MTTTAARVNDVLAWLERHGSKKNVEGMRRFGITAQKAFGVSMAEMQPYAKKLGVDHDLALALWETGWHEARAMSAFVGDPARLTPELMDRWARDFDNWAVCDTTCFKLFDRSPHAWTRIAPWAKRKDEFVRRAAFALLASLALHDKKADDAKFVKHLPLIERHADDDRNFVKKGVSWALRGIGHRSVALHAASVETATRLAASDDATARWVGRDALKDLQRPMVLKKVAKRG